MGAALPEVVERGLAAAHIEARDVAAAEPRAHKIHVMDVEHPWHDRDVHDATPDVVWVAALVQDALAGNHRFHVDACHTVFHVAKERGGRRVFAFVLQVAPVEIVHAGLVVQFHPCHQLGEIEFLGRLGDEQQAIVRKLVQPVAEGIRDGVSGELLRDSVST